MEITLLDFCLINILSYITGLGTGLIVCCKNKDKFFVKSRSIENISQLHQQSTQSQTQYSTPPIMASSPPIENKPIKITLE